MQVLELIKAGRVEVIVDRVRPLPDASKAHEISEQGHVRGKLAYQVAD